MKKTWRLILLGERRIAQQCVMALRDPMFRDAFDLRILVTNRLFYEDFLQRQPMPPPHFIANDERRAEEIAAAIAAQGVDLLISVQHNWVLPVAILEQVGGYAFNLHNARLPDYKGYHSISHALWRGDSEFISSLHWMAPKVDSGDMVYEGVTPIEPGDCAASLYLRTVNAATAAFVHLLRDLAAGRTPPRRPLQGQGKFYGRDSLAPLKRAKPDEDMITLDRRARAVFFPPHDPAHLEADGRRLFLLPTAAWPSLPPHWLNANQPDWSLPPPDVAALLAMEGMR